MARAKRKAAPKAKAKAKSKPKTKAKAKTPGKRTRKETPIAERPRIGRPVKFEDAQELFDVGYAWLKDTKRPTMAGLAVALGLSRQGLFEYGNKVAFSDTVKSLQAVLESKVEEGMLWDPSGQAGKIFWMKNNAGYSDKQEIDVSGTIVAKFDEADEDSL